MPFPLRALGDGSLADANFRALSQAVNHPVPQARVFNSANISLANNTDTGLTFDSETYDSGGLHSTTVNTGRLTAPITGLYHIGGYVQFALNAAGVRYVSIRLNGTTVIALDLRKAAAASVAGEHIALSTSYQLTAGDYVELRVLQDSGGALNAVAGNGAPAFWMHRVGGFVNVGV